MTKGVAAQPGGWPQGTVFTLGHSTLPIERFIALLAHYGIAQLADIRTVPASRRNPQYGSHALADSLAAAGIGYVHIADLGGLRHTCKDSPNAGWRNKSFRGYADHMQTHAFADAIDALIAMGQEKRTAIMCAEAVPWRCHRSLVADALEVRGVPVVDILSQTSWRMHRLTPFAQVDGTAIIYPAEPQPLP